MDLTKILAISGKPGLYEMISQTKTGLIVESMQDGKRFPVFTHERVSSLEEISIFSTGDEDTPLRDIFKLIFEKTQGQPTLDPKSSSEKLKEFFLEAVPEHDQERVYVSDIKKVLGWYNMLLSKGMLVFDEEVEVEEKGSEGVAEDHPETQSGESTEGGDPEKGQEE